MSRIQNFEDVIEALKPKLRDYLAEHDINTKTNFKCIHPDHDDHVASAGIIAKSDFTKWNCFSCGQSGDIFDAAHYLEGLPLDGATFIEETVIPLASKYGVDVKIKEPTEEERYRIDTFTAYKRAANYIANHPSPKALAEIERRGWDAAECASRLIGAVDSTENYIEHMKALGFPISFLTSIDLIKSDLFNPNNLIFTVCDESGRPCGFGARNLDYDKNNKEGLPKYINTSAKCPIYDKSKRLYNIHIAKKENPPMFVMEGYADVETCNQHGMMNTTCVGGTSFTEYHILELARLGKTEVVLCMDGDERGLASLDSMLEKFVQYRQFNVSIINIPEEMDPDDFIRSYGIDRFKQLKRWSAFEWKLKGYDDRIDPLLIRREVVPIIAAEVSAIQREVMAKTLSEKIGISMNAILEEVKILLDNKESKRAEEQKLAIEALVLDLKNNPSDWRLYMNSAYQNLETMSLDYGEDTFSTSAYLKDLDFIKSGEENTENTVSYRLNGFDEISNAIKGELSETLLLWGGAANTGKTGILSNLALCVAQQEDIDTLVLFHTIDDTLKQFTTRLVCQFAYEIMPNITLNMIKNPNAFPNSRQINQARDYGYSKLKELVARNRLLVRGGEESGGANLAYAEDMIRYYSKTFPNKKIHYFLDNFHRLRDFANLEERLRFKKLSTAAKDIAKKYQIPVWATVEYNKVGAWDGKPTNNSVSESIAMEYDANLMVHLYNDLHTKREDASCFFNRVDSQGMRYRAPRIEMIFGKNKITEFKGSLFCDFYTEQSRFQQCPTSVALEDIEVIKQSKKASGNGPKKY